MSTVYSDVIVGRKYNHQMEVGFDLTDGHCLGINQEEDRVLLSENQIVELIKFLKENGNPLLFKEKP